MDDVRDRLVRCFSSVFPVLTEEEIQAANLASLSDLDSLAAVILLTVIDEEFGVDIDLDRLLKLGSFEAVRQHLCEQAVSNVHPDEQRVE